jgi:thiamine biosynthesis lipoprotein
MTLSHSGLGRRGFIKIVGFSGLAAGLAIAVGRRSLASLGLARVVETRFLMGTYVQIILYADDQAAARHAAEKALGRMQEYEALLSRHRSDSALTSLNMHGAIDRPAAPLVDLLEFSRRVSVLTSGAFDLTIEPLARLIRQAAMAGAEITPSRLSQAARLVDYTAIEADEESVRFMQDGMAITPDGVGKGFILDEGLKVLRGMGFGHVMLDAGGDIVVSRGLGDPAWRIGIQDPRRPAGELVARVSLSDGAIATSGDYMHAYTPDLSLNHILDPRTGASPVQLSSASVIAPSAAMADALSTGLMVLGPVRGLELVQTIRDVECLLITKRGELVQSEGFPAESAS